MVVKKIMFLVVFAIITCSCKNNHQADSSKEETREDLTSVKNGVNVKNFLQQIDGESTRIYTISNANNIKAVFSNYGQRLISLYVPDKNGNLGDVVLGFNSLDEYRNAKEKFFGATIGRYGNRIAEGKFTLEGKEYTLATNNNANHLHGGNKGFESVVWKANQISDNKLEFTRTSPDGEEGYPGNLKVRVVYELTNKNELKIDYYAETDKKTPINLTHHSFFNLKGEGEGSINDHLLMINADSFTPVDDGLIPTGELKPVENTAFDFRKLKPIGSDLEAKSEQLEMGGGYDHNFVLNETPTNKDGLIFAARVIEPASGRMMEVYTTEPGLQFYGGNFLDGKAIGKSGKSYDYRGAFCLETQHFPNSPNQENFPTTILQPGDEYRSTCVYKFGISDKTAVGSVDD